MVRFCQNCSLLLVLLLLLLYAADSAYLKNGFEIQSSVFLSPLFVLEPGSVENKYYYDIDFPKGHIALKSFDAEVVDEDGNPVPLHETYLHHWIVAKYYERMESDTTKSNDTMASSEPDRILARNSGTCQYGILNQYFGLGSETRKTATQIPDPYGIEIGSPAEIPQGYEEKWLLNVHAIDTRGVKDRLGCTECRCDLYNVTLDEYDRPLRPQYRGGLLCCYDHTQCALEEGSGNASKRLYLRYAVKWVVWDSSIVPVKIFIFDVTDTGKRLHGSTGFGPENGCQVEYEIESCGDADAILDECIDTKKASLTMPVGGHVVYGVAHQHTGGIGSTLYGEDGRIICNSVPTYGNGSEVGDEAGYVVGMSSCYPKPGSVSVAAGETLILESNYSSTRGHTGVMGLFYILVAQQIPELVPLIDF